MIKKIFKNKQGKLFLPISLGFLVIVMFLFFLISDNAENLSENNFAETATSLITALNQKQAVMLYLQTSAELAVRETSQAMIAESAGTYNLIDTSNPNQEVTACGTHVYPLLSDTEGNVCFTENNYMDSYLTLFRVNLLKYTSRNPYLAGKIFSDINYDPDTNTLFGSAELPKVEILISKEPINFVVMPISAIENLDVEQSPYAKKLVKQIKKVDLTSDNFKDVGTGSCSIFINRLLSTVYETGNYELSIKYPKLRFPGHAWVVAARYLYHEKDRVVYAGPGLTYQQLLSKDGLLKEGDLLFSSSPGSWCKYTGYNYYAQTNTCRSNPEYRENPAEGFCVKDTIPANSPHPLYCSFNEGGVAYNNFPIVTHIFMYLGEDSDDKPIIANLYTKKLLNEPLESFVNNAGYSDGVRIIIRPDYPNLP